VLRSIFDYVTFGVRLQLLQVSEASLTVFRHFFAGPIRLFSSCVPVGPEGQLEDLGWRFREAADRHGDRGVFYQVTHRRLRIYLDMGLGVVISPFKVVLLSFSLFE
jgi:hypothetical protein